MPNSTASHSSGQRGAVESCTQPADTQPDGASAVLVLEDGSTLWGQGLGREGHAVGEVCFNTAMTGYQEIMTDPSYAGQLITFTFPHIGNVGTNDADVEGLAPTPACLGGIFRMDVTEPSNWRAQTHLNQWLEQQNLIALSGVDTRALTRRIRDRGAPKGCLAHNRAGDFDLEVLHARAQDWTGLEGCDLAKGVSRTQAQGWNEKRWRDGSNRPDKPFRVVVVDFGVKRNILRALTSQGCTLTVLPATSSADDILSHKPDGVFLSNGPGDPAATGAYALPMIRALLAQDDLPLFGICLGHQLLALALGAKTKKMALGHRGANHPVRDHTTGKVEITSQNHGFVVDHDSLPAGVVQTHVSLFDGTNQGLALNKRPVFSVQYHPEASPGPQDSHYLFDRFRQAMDNRRQTP